MRLTSLLGTNMDLTDSIKEYVDERVAFLEKLTSRFEPDVVLKVEVEKTTNHHAKGPFFRAEMNLAVPGKSFRAEDVAEDLYEAIDKVKDQLKRQVKEYKETRMENSKKKVRPGKEV